MSFSQQLRVCLPFRHSGSIPGGSSSTFAQYLSTSVRSEEKIRAMAANLVADGQSVPPTPRRLTERFGERHTLEEGELTASGAGMVECMAEINQAAEDPGFVHRSLVNSRGRLQPVRGMVDGLAAGAGVALRVEGQDGGVAPIAPAGAAVGGRAAEGVARGGGGAPS
jgi:hypothetical protein